MAPPAKSCTTQAATNQAYEAIMNEDLPKLTSLLQRPDAKQILEPTRNYGDVETLLRVAARNSWKTSRTSTSTQFLSTIFEAIKRVGGINFLSAQLDLADAPRQTALQLLCANHRANLIEDLPLFFEAIREVGGSTYLRSHLYELSSGALPYLVTASDANTAVVKMFLDNLEVSIRADDVKAQLNATTHNDLTAFQLAVYKGGSADLLELFLTKFRQLDGISGSRGDEDLERMLMTMGPFTRSQLIVEQAPILHLLCTNTHDLARTKVIVDALRRLPSSPNDKTILLMNELSRLHDEITLLERVMWMVLPKNVEVAKYMISLLDEFGLLQEQANALEGGWSQGSFQKDYARFMKRWKKEQQPQKKQRSATRTNKKQNQKPAAKKQNKKTAKKAAPKKAATKKKPVAKKQQKKAKKPEAKKSVATKKKPMMAKRAKK